MVNDSPNHFGIVQQYYTLDGNPQVIAVSAYKIKTGENEPCKLLCFQAGGWQQN